MPANSAALRLRIVLLLLCLLVVTLLYTISQGATLHDVQAEAGSMAAATLNGDGRTFEEVAEEHLRP